MNNEDQNLTNIFGLDAFMEGLRVDNVVQNEPKELAKTKLGSSRRLVGDLLGWKLTHLNDDLKKQHKSQRDWMLTCGRLGERLNEKALKNLPEGAPPPQKLPKNFKRFYPNPEEAIKDAKSCCATTMVTDLGDFKIPAEYQGQIAAALFMIRHKAIPGAEKVNFVNSTIREAKWQARTKVPCVELITNYMKTRFGRFDPTPDRKGHRHKQYPQDTYQRLVARVMSEFIDRHGNDFACDITHTQASDFIDYDVQRRVLKNKRRHQKRMKYGTQLSQFSPLRGLFQYALPRGLCDMNPFEDVVLVLAKLAKEEKLLRGEKEPYTIEQLSALLKWTWENDKLMNLAVLLAIFQGLRRCEIISAPGFCLEYRYNVLEVSLEMAKKKTLARVVPFFVAFKEWLALYPNLNELLLLIPIGDAIYSDRLKVAKEAVEIPGGGKDDLRKVFTSAMHKDPDIPFSAWQYIIGNVQGSSVSVAHYALRTNVKYLMKLKELVPKNVLGYNPPQITIQQLMVGVSPELYTIK